MHFRVLGGGEAAHDLILLNDVWFSRGQERASVVHGTWVGGYGGVLLVRSAHRRTEAAVGVLQLFFFFS